MRRSNLLQSNSLQLEKPLNVLLLNQHAYIFVLFIYTQVIDSFGGIFSILRGYLEYNWIANPYCKYKHIKYLFYFGCLR